MRGNRLVAAFCALLFALVCLSQAAWAQENQPPGESASKPRSMYNRRAYNAHRIQIEAFQKSLAGLKLNLMGDQALADLSLNTDMVSYRRDGQLIIEMVPEQDPMLAIMELALWRYGFLNRHSGEWHSNYNDWLYMGSIFDLYDSSMRWPIPPPITCPIYFHNEGTTINDDGSMVYVNLWGWYCQAEAYQYPGRCP